MNSKLLDKLSFLSLFLVVSLLPLFFLPFTKISVETSKGLLLVVGLVISILFWTIARFSDGQIILPRSSILVGGIGVILASLLSAFFSSAPQMSFFGTMFDVGSFLFILSGFILMLMSSLVFRKNIHAKAILFGVVLSSAVVLIFQVFHLFFPAFLSFGVLDAAIKTNNLLGTWNALALLSGFLGIVCLFVIEFFSITKTIKAVLGILLASSVIMIVIVNFLLAWKLLGFFTLIIFIYKILFSHDTKQDESPQRSFPGLSFALFIIAFLFFVFNQLIGGFLPNYLGLTSVDVNPSFSATLSVGKQALIRDPVLGIGPNRFAELWAMYKPSEINTTQFWNVPFGSGSGLIPTLAITTGLLGILSWFIFFILFLINGIKILFSGIREKINKESAIFFLASVYLFVCALLYPTGPVLFLLAFAFMGIFIGLSIQDNSKKEFSFSLSGDPRKSFSYLFILVFLMIFSVYAGFKYIERFASVSYFGRAVGANDIAEAKTNIIKAVSFSPNDLYLRTYAEINLIDINSVSSKETSLSDLDKANLQAALDEALKGANLAINYNKGNYLNYSLLGSVYSTVAALGVKDAYERAIEAYKQAETLNPLNPGLKLSMARVALTSGKKQEATDFAEEALSLKPNYIDALILLSQIANGEGKKTEALSYGEQALSFDPTNKDLIQYVDTLKRANISDKKQ